MVAYTSPDCLPYFTEDDPLCLNTGTTCDPSTLWCDFAAKVEERLDAMDEVVRRTAESTPIGWAETNVPVLFPNLFAATTYLPVFDEVRVDTDDMVSLDALPSVITVNTSGLYQIVAYTVGVFDTAGGAPQLIIDIALDPTVSIYGLATPSSGRSHMATPIDDVTLAAQVTCVLPVQAGSRITCSILPLGGSNETLILGRTYLAAAWLGDLP
jgi:hypothetical protein